MTNYSKEEVGQKGIWSEDMGAAAPWYRSEIGTHLRENTRSLFKSYCNLSGPELESHLHEIRDRSWKIRPYPCIGQWGFLEPGIFHSDAYGRILERLKSGQTILDVGCCMGQDLRRLAVDGAPTANMYATDIIGDFWDLGYDLFRDRDTMKAEFIKADILDTYSALEALHGKIDVVYVGSVLHLFGWAKQLQAARQFVLLSKVGTAVIGCQIGRNDAEEVTSVWGGGPAFYHNVDSLKKMWQIIEEETGTRWTVTASLGSLDIVGLEREDVAWMRPDTLLLQFLLIRIEK